MYVSYRFSCSDRDGCANGFCGPLLDVQWRDFSSFPAYSFLRQLFVYLSLLPGPPLAFVAGTRVLGWRGGGEFSVFLDSFCPVDVESPDTFWCRESGFPLSSRVSFFPLLPSWNQKKVALPQPCFWLFLSVPL